MSSFYCDYCSKWVRDTKHDREKHEQSSLHKKSLSLHIKKKQQQFSESTKKTQVPNVSSSILQGPTSIQYADESKPLPQVDFFREKLAKLAQDDPTLLLSKPLKNEAVSSVGRSNRLQSFAPPEPTRTRVNDDWEKMKQKALAEGDGCVAEIGDWREVEPSSIPSPTEEASEQEPIDSPTNVIIAEEESDHEPVLPPGQTSVQVPEVKDSVRNLFKRRTTSNGPIKRKST
ncbi:hypothetical protein RCL1_002660 [Eukaryota sp. TZLM3-RCL]